MSPARLTQLSRRVERDLTDFDALVELCRLSSRTGHVPAAFETPEVRGALGRAWLAAPRERALWEFVLPRAGLRVLERGSPPLGRFWIESGRLQSDRGVTIDRLTGLPLAYRRHRDGALMLLVPGSQPFLLDQFPVTRAQAAAHLPRSARVVQRIGGERGRLPVSGFGKGELYRVLLALGVQAPSPSQWLAACGDAAFPWGIAPPTPRRATLAPWAQSLTTVDATPEGVGPYGHRDLIGNAAELTLDEAGEAHLAGARFDTPAESVGAPWLRDWDFSGEPVGRGVGARGCLDLAEAVS